MYPFNLTLTEEKHYTALPGPIADKTSRWLKEYNIWHELLDMEEVPDDVPCGYTYHGRSSIIGVAYILSHIPPAELVAAAEKRPWARYWDDRKIES